jgi:hypothetical protein
MFYNNNEGIDCKISKFSSYIKERRGACGNFVAQGDEFSQKSIKYRRDALRIRKLWLSLHR